jgi:hypothetical protein
MKLSLHNLKHKLAFWASTNLKTTWKRYGLPLLIIFIAWEIIEDVIFPLIFAWLGANVNPAFFAGIPVAWLLCLHPIAVPLIWWVYCFILRKDKCEHGKAKDICEECLKHEICS